MICRADYRSFMACDGDLCQRRQGVIKQATFSGFDFGGHGHTKGKSLLGSGSRPYTGPIRLRGIMAIFTAGRLSRPVPLALLNDLQKMHRPDFKQIQNLIYLV